MTSPDLQRPLVTVMLFCYNQQQFVADSVSGVLTQTYSPIEFIIVEDSSTDQTACVIERTIAQHSRSGVRFIRNPRNIGGHASTDMALRLAKGEFLFISHGDDIMLPQMVEKLAGVWMAERVSLVTANAYYIDENSQTMNRTFRDLDQPADDSFETLARDGSNACCFGPAIGFERAIYDEFGWVPRYLGCYDIMYPFYAYLLNGARFVGDPLLKYRVHGKNSSLSLQKAKAETREQALIDEQIYTTHLAHAVLMEEELDRLRHERLDRYRSVAEHIMPLLTVQMVEMGRKLVRVSRQSGSLAAR